MQVERTDSQVSVKITPTDVAQWDNCRRLLAYEQIWQVQPASRNPLEIFGGCIEQSVYQFLLVTANGETPDPMEYFVRLWRQALDEHPLPFSEREEEASFERAGMKLMQMLPRSWKWTGLTVVCHPDGTPWVQRRASVEWDLCFTETPKRALELIGTIGVVVERPGLGRGLLQVATVRTPHTHNYTRRTDILTGHQFLYHEECNNFGFFSTELEAVGFWDFIKTESGASIAEPLFVPARKPAATSEFCDKVDQMSLEVVHRRFFRTSRWEWNTPCAHCPYAWHCLDNETGGLLFPDRTPTDDRWPPAASNATGPVLAR